MSGIDRGLLAVREARAHAEHYEGRFDILVSSHPEMADLYEACRDAMSSLSDALRVAEVAVLSRGELDDTFTRLVNEQG